MMYSQNDETGVLEVVEFGFYNFLFLILSVDFTFWWWHLCKFHKNY